MSIDAALQALFGADPDRIEVSDLHHLACTLTPHHVELLLRAGGGRWTKILDRIEHKRALAKAAKDPGEDVRNREEKPKAAPRERRLYEMTAADYATLIEAARSVPLIALQCGMPKSPQENANDAWRALGDRMGFDGMSVQPDDRGPRFFTAIAKGDS